jgi:hypothetical protein
VCGSLLMVVACFSSPHCRLGFMHRTSCTQAFHASCYRLTGQAHKAQVLYAMLGKVKVTQVMWPPVAVGALSSCSCVLNPPPLIRKHSTTSCSCSPSQALPCFLIAGGLQQGQTLVVAPADQLTWLTY